MQKEITKWWLAGQINDTEYAKVLKYTVDKSNIIPSSNKLPTDIILADGPDGHEKNATSYSAIMKDKMTSVILKRIPFKPENNTTGNLQIPQWFKSKAGLWSNEQNLTDNDFVNGINYLFGVATG